MKDPQVFSAADRMDWGSKNSGPTSVGALGFWLTSVSASQALRASTKPAARAPRVRMYRFMWASSLWPDREGHPDASSRRDLSELDTLHVAGVEGGLGIDVVGLRPQRQVAPDQRDLTAGESQPLHEPGGQLVRETELPELQVARIHDAGLMVAEVGVEVVHGAGGDVVVAVS